MKPSERIKLEIALRKASEAVEAIQELLDNNPKPEKLIVTRKFTPFDVQAATYLDATLQVNVRGYKKRKDIEIERWADEFRKMRELDKHEEEMITEVLKWTVKHPFWKMQIRSGMKFRDKYEILLAQMQTPDRIFERPVL